MKRTRGKPERRMGPTGSDNWHAMLDGAEEILRDEGHACLTSRRVAERIGVKQRLVYYYFRTMDDLIVETFRRLSERELKRLRSASDSEEPLREIWDVCIHTADARLIAEFMALANRISGLRREVVRFIEESRAIQVEAITAALERSSRTSGIPPRGLAILATSVALSLTREEQLGIRSAHEEIVGVIEEFLSSIEPKAVPARRARADRRR
jgi:AcrR family transcriptional regulator